MDAGHDHTNAASTRTGRQLWLIAVGVLVVGLLIGGIAGGVLGGKGEAEEKAADDVAAVADDTATTVAPNVPVVTDPVDQGAGGQDAPAEPPPTIVSFTSKVTAIGCVTPGVDLSTTVYWETEGALGVTLQVGNKPEAAFGPNGNADVAVHCDGQPTVYTLTAKGLGGETAQQISVAAQVPKPVILTLKAGPQSVVCQQAQINVLVSWSVKHADTVVLEGLLVSASGAKSFTIPCDGDDDSFVLNAAGLGGSVIGHTTVNEILL